ncbi:MAG: AsmA family protein [Methyloceanibacter sp.]|uniref:AsmA family protein n=1 Tax=Methyloceanibacter sp. TaxID=1965321 RepID=UPI003D6D71C3
MHNQNNQNRRQPQHPPPLPPQLAQPWHAKLRTTLGAMTQGAWSHVLSLSGSLGLRRRVLIIGGAVVGVLVALLVAVNLIISADWVEARVAARIKEQTGRDLVVDGSTMLLFTPGPHVVITDARITDPNAQAGTADLSVAKLTLDLNFAELLGRQVDAERVVLVRPVLTVRLGGEPRLRFGNEDRTPHKIRFAKAETGGMPAKSRDVRLKDVRIEDGTVVIIYDDKDENAEKRIEHIDAELSLPALARPFVGRGKLDWKGERVHYSFELKTPAELRAKRSARLLLALDTKAIAARFDGSLATEPHLAGKGRLSAKASSIPSVLALMRESPPMATAIGDGELESEVSWSEGEITFSNARFALEHASGQAQAVIALKSPRPHVRAALALDQLDLNPFLASKRKRAENPKVKTDAPEPSPAPAAAPKDWFAKPTEVVVQKVAPPPRTMQAPGAAAQPVQEIAPPPKRVAAPPTAVSDIEIAATRASPPAAFDADLNLNVRKTRVGHLDIGPSSLSVVFRDGVMNATLGGMELYDGHASGTLVFDASKPVPAFSGDFRLEGVEAKPLLSDAAQFDMISGRTKLALKLSGEGVDAGALKSSLRGDGSVVVSNGAIEGIDITALIGGLGQGEFDLRQGPDAKTAFSDLGGSFTIADGVAETKNLKMNSPLLKVTAEGTVDLARSNIDILAHPQIVEGPEGKNGANDLAGLTVPVRIEGPLDDPRIKPELKAVFANPDGASEAVNKIGEALQKKFKGRPVGEALGRFLGNVQIGPRRAAPQALGQPQAGDPEQGDSDDDAMDPELEEILR